MQDYREVSSLEAAIRVARVGKSVFWTRVRVNFEVAIFYFWSDGIGGNDLVG